MSKNYMFLVHVSTHCLSTVLDDKGELRSFSTEREMERIGRVFTEEEKNNFTIPKSFPHQEWEISPSIFKFKEVPFVDKTECFSLIFSMNGTDNEYKIEKVIVPSYEIDNSRYFLHLDSALEKLTDVINKSRIKNHDYYTKEINKTVALIAKHKNKIKIMALNNSKEDANFKEMLDACKNKDLCFKRNISSELERY